jgi:hypothetical protein
MAPGGDPSSVSHVTFEKGALAIRKIEFQSNDRAAFYA